MKCVNNKSILEINTYNSKKKNIIISAINIREGGPLTILKKCLGELSQSKINNEYNIIALVYLKSNCFFNNITYFEFPKAKIRAYSYFMEYFGLKKFSKKINPELWISLTDKTPWIYANTQVVYLHNPTFFFQMKLKDFIYSPFLLLYVMFYKNICAINIHRNNYLIVQQDWLRDAYTNLFRFARNKCIVFPPLSNQNSLIEIHKSESSNKKSFIFASIPRGFKNFEIICEANKLLLNRGLSDHRIVLTLKGDENRYTKSILRKYGNMTNILFIGVVTHSKLNKLYTMSDCLIFPSRLETWGLPISEFSVYDKPMLLADLPYAHNTAMGSKKVAFFNPYDAFQLAGYMEKIILNDLSFLEKVNNPIIDKPQTFSWAETISFALSDK
jgi:hypothetical protein